MTVASLLAAACETRRKLAHRPARRAIARAPWQAWLAPLAALVVLAVFASRPLTLAAQTPEPQREGAATSAPAPAAAEHAAAQSTPAAEHGAAEHAPAEHAPAEHAAGEHGGGEHGGSEHGEAEEHHGRGIIDDIARLVNFAILVGTLAYLFGGQLKTYIADRGNQIRGDLVNAAETKKTASAQIAEIDQKMRALPAELEALRTQGAQEIAAEEARINAAAAAERDRLLDQARREIDMQTRIAERDLVAHAGELAVGVAADRIKKSITDADQQRLIDQYVGQLKG